MNIAGVLPAQSSETTPGSDMEGDAEDLDSFPKDDALASDKAAMRLQFLPPTILSEWEDADNAMKRISVAVILPSVVASGDFRIVVRENCSYLDLRVLWPAPLYDVDVLHKHWLMESLFCTPNLFAKISGFKKFLKWPSKHNTDRVVSTTMIELPQLVYEFVDNKVNLAWRECKALVVYLNLPLVEDQSYTSGMDKDTFTLSQVNRNDALTARIPCYSILQITI